MYLLLDTYYIQLWWHMYVYSYLHVQDLETCTVSFELGLDMIILYL